MRFVNSLSESSYNTLFVLGTSITMAIQNVSSCPQLLNITTFKRNVAPIRTVNSAEHTGRKPVYRSKRLVGSSQRLLHSLPSPKYSYKSEIVRPSCDGTILKSRAHTKIAPRHFCFAKEHFGMCIFGSAQLKAKRKSSEAEAMYWTSFASCFFNFSAPGQ